MKFTKLVDKFEKLLHKHEKGDSIEVEKLTKLQQLLSDKRNRYQASLDTTSTRSWKKLKNCLRAIEQDPAHFLIHLGLSPLVPGYRSLFRSHPRYLGVVPLTYMSSPLARG
jgi:hypothetical protein